MPAAGYNEPKINNGSANDIAGIKDALRGFYTGLSEFDMKALEANTAPGYYLLEHGEYWNLEYTQFKVGNEKPPGFSRSNRFDFKRIDIFGDDAFAVWDLFADVRKEARDFQLYWLESGSFKKVDGVWKVHFLHSTRSTPAGSEAS